ncbi:hypothetical protein ACFE04_012511 [Oxalis oulophora]
MKANLIETENVVSLQTTTEPEPVYTSVKSFAPATVENLGPGFDFLGAAVDGLGDFVSLRIDSSVNPGLLSIAEISGTGAKLTKNPMFNCAGIAAIAVMKMLGIRAAAAAVAVNELFGNQLSAKELVLAGLESEAKISGYHADNIAPAIMGGFVLIRNYEPLILKSLKFPDDKTLFFVLVSPEFEAPTKKMRAALPDEVGMSNHVWNCSQSLSNDRIVEPKRAPLIPGIVGVKKAAIEAGAFGCTISGAGPTAVAITDNEEKGKEIGARMVEAFWKEGSLKAVAVVKKLDRISGCCSFRSSREELCKLNPRTVSSAFTFVISSFVYLKSYKHKQLMGGQGREPSYPTGAIFTFSCAVDEFMCSRYEFNSSCNCNFKRSAAAACYLLNE